MLVPPNPLRIQFGNNTVLVWCDDCALRQSLGQHFRHCQGEGASATVIYQINEAEANHAWQLLRDGLLLYRGLSSARIVERLMQDVTLMLIKHCPDQLLFHAAGLADGDSGLILCGGSGSGKSTLAAWLIAIGFDYLTDELVAVNPDQTAMSGLARPIVLKTGSTFVWQHWLDETAFQSITHFPDGTVWLDPEALRPDCVCTSAYPRLVFFPRYATGEPLATSLLSTAESAFRLMQHLINAKNLPNWGFAAIKRLVRQTTAYSLTYADVDLAANWIKQTTLAFQAKDVEATLVTAQPVINGTRINTDHTDVRR